MNWRLNEDRTCETIYLFKTQNKHLFNGNNYEWRERERIVFTIKINQMKPFTTLKLVDFYNQKQYSEKCDESLKCESLVCA